jgi:hypothetical protein
MFLPHRPAVEPGERIPPRVVIAETTQPDEMVDAVDIAELADDADAEGFLRLDELAVEELDQLVAPTAVQEVLAQLNDRRRKFKWMIRDREPPLLRCFG